MKTRTIITTLLIAVCTNIASTEVIGGFTGVMLGLFAQGEDGDGYADFDWFEYITE